MKLGPNFSISLYTIEVFTQPQTKIWFFDILESDYFWLRQKTGRAVYNKGLDYTLIIEPCFLFVYLIDFIDDL